MAKRVWIVSAAAFALIVLAAAGSAALSRSLAQLRTDHARPAAYAPGGPIVVTALGKTFHRPGCGLIHGPAQTVTAVGRSGRVTPRAFAA